jgi:hypothetical protein
VSRLPQRADTFRALRAEIEAGVRDPLTALATEHAVRIAGKIASHPAVMRFGSRVASEGDVDAGWARPA